MLLSKKRLKKNSMTAEEENTIKEIKTFILRSNEIDQPTKLICFALIDASNGFTEQVYFEFSLMPVIDTRRLGISGIKDQLNEIMVETGFQFFYFEEMENYRSLFYLLRIPFDCYATKITEDFVKNTELVI